jgi:type IV pilus assembly protein PilQ
VAETAAADVARGSLIAGVELEQATTVDGKDLARVRVALAGPAAYKLRSSRNVIRLELEPDASKAFTTEGTATPTRHAEVPDDPAVVAATTISRVRASHTRTSTVVTLSGNGRLVPASLSESEDQPRRLVLDFPNVSPDGVSRSRVDGVFVKQVRVAVNSRDPLLTRVVMEISPSAIYHVERAGSDGRDLAVVFEGRAAGGVALVAPPERPAAGETEPDERISMSDAIRNAASMTPTDPIAALLTPAGGPSTAPDPGQAPAAPAPAPAQPAAAAPPSIVQGAQTPAPVTQDAPPPGTTRQYTGAPVSFDFEDSDLRVVLRLFSQISGLNMIIDPQVQGRVNVVLTDVPWDQALEQILRSNKLGYSVEGNIMRIAPLAVLADEQAQTQKLNEAKALAGELQTRTFQLSYAKAAELNPLLTSSVLSPRGKIQVDARTNTLIITDLADRIQSAQGLLSTLDRPQPQVEVQARVVQTNRDFVRQLGIQWGFNGRANSQIGNTTGLAFPNSGSLGGRVGTTQGPSDPRGGNENQQTNTAVNLATTQAPSSALGIALGSINGAFNLDVALTALENTGKGRVLSEPRLTTQNNQQAIVRQGVQIPVQTVANNTVTTTYVNADLSLTVTPQITAANTVIMNVALTNAAPDFTKAVNGTPPINSQSATTVVQVNDGSTTVIGGIFVSEEQTNNDRTPYLYRVPILKWLFQRNSITDSSRELLIFITPRILRG